MRPRCNYIGKRVSCMQLFYGGVPHDVVTCEANILYQYIYKHKLISVILILGTSFWSNLQHKFQKLRMVYLILQFCSAIERWFSSHAEKKPVKVNGHSISQLNIYYTNSQLISFESQCKNVFPPMPGYSKLDTSSTTRLKKQHSDLIVSHLCIEYEIRNIWLEFIQMFGCWTVLIITWLKLNLTY
jgi:hypothetical protein